MSFRDPCLGNTLWYCLATYIAACEHQNIRSKPVFRESLIILVILEFYGSLLVSGTKLLGREI